MVFVKCALFVMALAAVSSSQPSEPRLILDMILKKALESLKPKLKDLEIPNQVFELNKPEIKISATLENGLVKHLDEFVINKLTTQLIPLKLTNLTITLDHVELTGNYSLNASLTIPEFTGDVRMYGNGSAKIDLHGIFFTIAADFVFKHGKFQIPENGLHGFDIYIAKSKVQLENLLGGGIQGKLLNQLLSELIPDLVRDYKNLAFEYSKGSIIKIINDYLTGNKIDDIYVE